MGILCKYKLSASLPNWFDALVKSLQRHGIARESGGKQLRLIITKNYSSFNTITTDTLNDWICNSMRKLSSEQRQFHCKELQLVVKIGKLFLHVLPLTRQEDIFIKKNRYNCLYVTIPAIIGNNNNDKFRTNIDASYSVDK